MAQDILKYEECFSVGQRIQVEIPLAGGKTFRDDAEIVSLQQDLLQLQLSRAVLPESACLAVGTLLYVRIGKSGNGFRCRGMVLACDSQSGLLVRLTGETLSLDDREFFRIDVYIPLTYCLQGADPDLTPARPLPVAANLSGAGLRMQVPEHFPIDQFLDLTLVLPPEYGGAMHLTGQVVYVMELSRPDAVRRLFDTALRFVGVSVAHRDRLVKFIHAKELEQLQRLREQSALLPAAEPGTCGWGSCTSREKVRLVLYGVAATLLAVWLILSLVDYYRAGRKGVIEKTFEDQIKKILKHQ
jgi:hypothetical protein